MINDFIQFIFNNFNIYLILLLILSILLDLMIGELPNKIHPVVIIGKTIDKLSKPLLKIKNKFSGIFLTITTLLINIILQTIIYSLIIFISLFLNLFLSIFFNILLYNYLILNYYIIFKFSIFGILISILLSGMFSINLLISSSLNVKEDMNKGLDQARNSISMLVSRDTSNLSEEPIISATIESMTENITDSYVSYVFYFLLFGLIGIYLGLSYYYVIFLALIGTIIYRTINTLDAMVGYKNQKLSNIGWFPAHLDDILNYIPSRFAGLMVILSAYNLKMDGKNSYKILRRDARNSPSPNSGFTMAAVAGALRIQLEKKDTYIMGDKTQSLNVEDIDNAVKLTKRTILLSTIFLIIIYLILNFIIINHIDFSFLNFTNVFNFFKSLL